MARQIEIELDGVAVTATLQEQRAPKTCEGFWSILPHEQIVMHGMWSGNVFRTTATVPMPKEVTSQFKHPRPGIEDRSFKTNMNAGDVIFYHGDGINEVCIAYAEGQFRDGPGGTTYVTLLARVHKDHANYRKFLETCAKLHTEGKKRIVYRRKE